MKQTQAISKETLSTIYGGNKYEKCLVAKTVGSLHSPTFGGVVYYHCITG